MKIVHPAMFMNHVFLITIEANNKASTVVTVYESNKELQACRPLEVGTRLFCKALRFEAPCDFKYLEVNQQKEGSNKEALYIYKSLVNVLCWKGEMNYHTNKHSRFTYMQLLDKILDEYKNNQDVESDAMKAYGKGF